MAEPNATIAGVSLVTLAVAVFGPQAGPYAVIMLGSLGGGLWALSSATLTSRAEGAWMMLRCVITAIVLTAAIAQTVGPMFNYPVTESYAVVSFAIGMLGNKWLEIIESIKQRIQNAITNGGKP